MEVFSWEDGYPRAFLPSEALLYAIVHNHQDYARHLLDRYGLSALKALRCSVCCGEGAPHLKTAVRYDRVDILGMMVGLVQAEGVVREFLDGCGGCTHAVDAGKSAVQLSVELSRTDCLLLLLAHGAQPDGLDAALQCLATCSAPQRRPAMCCLRTLLLFLPTPPPPNRLRDQPQHWQSLLGTEVFGWLCGLSPPPLLLQALRCLVRSGPDSINTLPEFLHPHSWP